MRTLIVVLLFCFSAAGADAAQWVEVCGNEYLFSNDFDTWSQAKQNCHLYGGYLAKINGVIENTCLHEWAIDNINQEGKGGGIFWHSANDRIRESVFR